MDQNIDKPEVSIILSVYNGAKYLEKAIKSVLRQSFANFELIIINDGSTDDSLKIIDGFNDPRIKKIDQINQGLIASLNTGLRLSQAPYIARIDADDIWSDPEKLAKQMEYISRNPDCAIVGTWARIMDENDKEFSLLSYPQTDREIRSQILIRNCFIHPSVVFNKKTALEAGGFSDEDKYMEDYGLWLKMGKIGTFANIPEYLMSYRIHKESTTRRKNLVQAKNSLRAIKKNKALYPNYTIGLIKWNLKIFLLRIKNLF